MEAHIPHKAWNLKSSSHWILKHLFRNWVMLYNPNILVWKTSRYYSIYARHYTTDIILPVRCLKNPSPWSSQYCPLDSPPMEWSWHPNFLLSPWIPEKFPQEACYDLLHICHESKTKHGSSSEFHNPIKYFSW